MRPLPNSDEFHPTEWSPAIPIPVRRPTADAEASVRPPRGTTRVPKGTTRLPKDTTRAAEVWRLPVAQGGERRLLGIQVLIG